MKEISTRVFIFFCAIFYVVIGFGSNMMGWVSEDTRWQAIIAKNTLQLTPYTSTTSSADPGLLSGQTPAWLTLMGLYVRSLEIVGVASAGIPSYFTLPFYFVDILLVVLLSKTIKSMQPTIEKEILWTIIGILFFSGFLLHTSGYSSHTESLVVVLIILGISNFRAKKIVKTGFLLGLAFLVKQTSLVLLWPLFIYIYQKQRTAIKKISFTFLLTVFSGLAAFFIHKPLDTWYGIAVNKLYLTVSGPNIWWLLDSILSRIFKLDVATYIAVPSILLTIIVITYSSCKYFNIDRPVTKSDNIWKALVVASFAFSIFGYWTWFRYFLFNFIFLLLWEVERQKDFPFIWATYSFILFALQFLGFPVWQLAILCLNGVFFAKMIIDLRAKSED